MGERGTNGGPNGDLFVEVNVKPHEFFKRDGNDIHLTVPVDFIDAILGTSVDVPTVYGEATLNIPAGTQPGQIFRMRGQGVKDLRSGKPGDQYVHLDIKMPTSLNRKQKDAGEVQKNLQKINRIYPVFYFLKNIFHFFRTNLEKRPYYIYRRC